MAPRSPRLVDHAAGTLLDVDVPTSVSDRDRDRGGRLRRALTRLTTSRDEMHAEELLTETREVGATPVSECGDRQRVTVAGVLRTVTLRPRAGVPALEAELFDGSGAVTLVWLGRRQIPGIDPGRAVEACGVLTHVEGGKPVLYNPRYTLRPSGAP